MHIKESFCGFLNNAKTADRFGSTVAIFIEKEPLLAPGLVVGLDLLKDLVGFGVAVSGGFPDDGE